MSVAAQKRLASAVHDLEQSEGWAVIRAWLRHLKKDTDRRRLSANLFADHYRDQQLILKGESDAIEQMMELPERIANSLDEEGVVEMILKAIREFDAEK